MKEEEIFSILEKDCPVWFNRLTNIEAMMFYSFEENYELMNDYRYCIVGEFHKNNSDYSKPAYNRAYCSTCTEYAEDLLAAFESEDRSLLFEYISKFLNHWKRKKHFY